MTLCFLLVIANLWSLIWRQNGGFFDGLSITSPSAYQVFQRSGSTGNITISGTYTGSPTAIEARFNGGAWATIDSSLSGGVFSGALSSQSQGQGTLEVRFTNNTGISSSVSNVGIGDIFVIAGQSNASGRGTNNQAYSHASLKAGLYKNNYAWAELADPTDANPTTDTVSEDGSAAGSVWPLLATSFMADQSVPIAFIPTAKGASLISDWLPGADHQDRTTLYGSMVYRALQAGGVKAVLWWQGEQDAFAGTSQANYNSRLDTIANAIQADLGVKLMPALLQNTVYDETAVNAAIVEAQGDNANVLDGPDFSDIDTDDSAHLQTDGKLSTAAGRWWTALETAFY